MGDKESFDYTNLTHLEFKFSFINEQELIQAMKLSQIRIRLSHYVAHLERQLPVSFVKLI